MEAMKEMEDNQFDLAIVDPPYGIQKNMRGSRRMGTGITTYPQKNTSIIYIA
jgi:DNA modification methylase